jgi:hypothetical protein
MLPPCSMPSTMTWCIKGPSQNHCHEFWAFNLQNCEQNRLLFSYFTWGYFVIFGKWSKALPLVLNEKREGAVLQNSEQYKVALWQKCSHYPPSSFPSELKPLVRIQRVQEPNWRSQRGVDSWGPRGKKTRRHGEGVNGKKQQGSKKWFCSVVLLCWCWLWSLTLLSLVSEHSSALTFFRLLSFKPSWKAPLKQEQKSNLNVRECECVYIICSGLIKASQHSGCAASPGESVRIKVFPYPHVLPIFSLFY